MLSVLSKLAIAVAVVCGPPLAGLCCAQYRRYDLPGVRRVSYQEPVEEAIAPGARAAPGNGEAGNIQPGGEFVGEADGMWDDGPSLFSPMGGWLDEGGEALIPDGLWNNRGPDWYVSAGVSLLRQGKSATQADALHVATNLVEVTTTQQLLRPDVMTTAGPGFRIVPGLRLTVGRNLFEDIVNRQHAIEFQFLGLNAWEGSAAANGTTSTLLAPTLFKFANLWSFFPFSVTAPANTIGGFNNASQMTIVETSAFNNFEMNYRITRLPRPDRIAQMPDGTWIQTGTPSMVHSLLAGVRVFTFNDHFNWLSTGNFSGTAPIPGAPFSGLYNIKTTNALVGPQIGGDVFMHYNIWTMGIRSKAGVYYNSAKQLSEVQIIDPINGNSGGVGRGNIGTVAFIGDLGFVTTARLMERTYFRFSYDFLWVAGLANAPDQLQYTTDIAPTVRANGHRLFQGVSLGFDFCW